MTAYDFDCIAAPVFVLEPDSAGRPVYVGANAYAYRTSNLTEAQVAGRSAAELWPGRQGRHMQAAQMRCLATGLPLTYSVLSVSEGQHRLYESFLTPQADATGRVARLIGIVTDRTKEAALREELALSRVVQDEMAVFMSMAAQDLSAPLSIVRDLTDSLRHGFQDLGDGKLQAIDRLEQLASVAVQLIGDMVDNLPGEKAAAERSVIALARCVDDALVVADPEDLLQVQCADLLLDVDDTILQIILREIFAMHSATTGRSHPVQVDAFKVDEGWVRIALTGIAPEIMLDQVAACQTGAADPLGRVQRLVEAVGGLLQFQERPGGARAMTFTMPARLVGAADGAA
ncbi:MAG: PAS domain-containing protein [Pseudomonadota bacterium]